MASILNITSSIAIQRDSIMHDLTRALLFISLFAGVFIGTMVLENWWAKRRGVNKLYHFPETFTNMMTGLSYKVVDGIAIALFIQVFYDWMYQFGLQWNPDLTLFSVLVLVFFIDFWFYKFLSIFMDC